MAKDKGEKIVADDDPRRCAAMTPRGQCDSVRVPGSINCRFHGGAIGAAQTEKKNLRNYRLAKWQSRVSEFAESDGVKSVLEEVGILRMLMEERLNKCQSAGDLLLQSGPISDLAQKIDKLVNSAHRLDNSLGNLLSKEKVITLAHQIIEVIAKHVEDSDVVELIAEEIQTLLTTPERNHE